MTLKKEFFPLIHTIIMLFAWVSPFWLDWKIIGIILILYLGQIILFKGCMLTNLQFDKKLKAKNDMTLTAYWLEKIGKKPNRKILRIMGAHFILE